MPCDTLKDADNPAATAGGELKYKLCSVFCPSDCYARHMTAPCARGPAGGARQQKGLNLPKYLKLMPMFSGNSEATGG
jgi:hypothetical protein